MPQKPPQSPTEYAKRVHLVKSGNTTLRIYEGSYEKECRDETRTYCQFTAVYVQAGQRRRKTFSTLDAALDFTKDMAEKIDTNRLDVAAMDNADQQSYAFAVRALGSLGETIPLHVAVEEFVASRMLLPTGVSLVSAAQDYAERLRDVVTVKFVHEVVEEFILNREVLVSRGEASTRDLQTVRSHCRQFANVVKKRIDLATYRDVESFLLVNTDSRKTWNNKRISLTRLFSFARDRGYLPQDKRTAPQRVKPKKKGDSDVTTLSPLMLVTLLEGATDEITLWLVLAAFTGMRTSELERLEWDWIDSKRGVIRLPYIEATKQRKRSIPIQPNLCAWLERLAHLRNPSGLVFAAKAQDAVIAHVKGKGIEWVDNWARHSYGTYRATITKSVGTVALEMGNSEAMVKNHYFDQHADEEDAQTWFAIMPPDRPANVVEMREVA
jgi:integrase